MGAMFYSLLIVVVNLRFICSYQLYTTPTAAL